ncbi:putative nuclease HARBI1 [Tanacetum coccineum]
MELHSIRRIQLIEYVILLSRMDTLYWLRKLDMPYSIEVDTPYQLERLAQACVGCIDGTHIEACIPETQRVTYIGEKGIPTFNVMTVFDKGCPSKNGYLVPYPKIRYHKPQFENEPPNNMQKDFNRSHSSLRSAIERSFGILKKRWKILSRMPKYSVETQHDVIIATLALHNYIRNNDKEDTFTTFEQHPNYMGGDDFSDVRGSSTNNDDTHSGTSNEMKYIRNGIATSIWNARRR